MRSVIIRGVGAYVPERVLTNADLEQLVDTSNEWIVTRTGIESRRICLDSEATSDLCVKAAERTVEAASMSLSDLDAIIVATITPDVQFPSTACIVQRKLGCTDIPCFDISAACSGFIYALDVACGLLSSNTALRNILVIGAEKLSSIVDWEDRSTCVLFGDGAGAAVISREVNSDSEAKAKGTQGVSITKKMGIIDILIGADGRCEKMLYCPGGGSAMPATVETVENREHFIKMEGKGVFKEAVRRMSSAVEDILLRNRLTPDDIALVIPHQANTRIISAVAERTGIPEEKMFVNLDHTGNTSAASIPIALAEAVEGGRVRKGDLIVLVAFGAGMTWGSALIRW